MPLDHLKPDPIFVKFIKDEIIGKYGYPENFVIIASDNNAFKRYSNIIRHFEIKYNIKNGYANKDRIDDSRVKVDSIIGDVSGKDIILLDDEICKATTMKETAILLHKMGAKSISIMAVHGLFSDNYIANFSEIKNLKEDFLKIVAVTDTVPAKDEVINNFRENRIPLKIISISELLANVIKAIYFEESVSKYCVIE